MSTLVLIAKAAQETTYSTDHIRYLVRNKLVLGDKQGGTWLVDLDDLKKYEERMKEAGTKKFDPTQGKLPNAITRT